MAPSPGPTGFYHRREPEHTVLHQVVREHLESFLEAGGRKGDDRYPPFIEREFRRYLDCGLLCHGFARVRCEACGDEILLAFSCKGRMCPSCQGRRMCETAAYLVDQRLPEAPYRHWVLTVPWVLRYRLSVDRPLLSAVLRTFLRTVFAWQRRRGRARGLVGETGAITFVQRFGGALNLHPHLHSLIPDGLFVPGSGDTLTFAPLPVPTPEEIESLTLRIAQRVSAQIERVVAAEGEIGGRLEETAASLQEALHRSLSVPPPADQLTWTPELDHATSRRRLCAKVAGFSLHAAQAVAPGDRVGLERLCRYGLRAPFSEARLPVNEAGAVVYTLARPWPDASGITELVMSPTELLRRLAALCPSPGTHLIRYHGVFANRSRWRDRLPSPPPSPGLIEAQGSCGPRPEEAPGSADPSSASPAPPRPAHTTRQRLCWAQLLARIFYLDVLWCPRCGGRRQIVSFLTDPAVVRRILTHLGLPTEAPVVALAGVGLSGGMAVEGDLDDPTLFVERDEGWESPGGQVQGRGPPD